MTTRFFSVRMPEFMAFASESKTRVVFISEERLLVATVDRGEIWIEPSWKHWKTVFEKLASDILHGCDWFDDGEPSPEEAFRNFLDRERVAQ